MGFKYLFLILFVLANKFVFSQDSLQTSVNDTIIKRKVNLLIGIQWSFSYDVVTNFAHKNGGNSIPDNEFDMIPFPTLGFSTKKWVGFLDFSYSPFENYKETNKITLARGHKHIGFQISYDFLHNTLSRGKPYLMLRVGQTQLDFFTRVKRPIEGTIYEFESTYKEKAQVTNILIAAGGKAEFKRFFIHLIFGMRLFSYYNSRYSYNETDYVKKGIISPSYQKVTTNEQRHINEFVSRFKGNHLNFNGNPFYTQIKIAFLPFNRYKKNKALLGKVQADDM